MANNFLWKYNQICIYEAQVTWSPASPSAGSGGLSTRFRIPVACRNLPSRGSEFSLVRKPWGTFLASYPPASSRPGLSLPSFLRLSASLPAPEQMASLRFLPLWSSSQELYFPDAKTAGGHRERRRELMLIEHLLWARNWPGCFTRIISQQL